MIGPAAHRVALRRMPAQGGTVAPGQIVDTTGWSRLDALESTSYVGPLPSGTRPVVCLDGRVFIDRGAAVAHGALPVGSDPSDVDTGAAHG